MHDLVKAILESWLPTTWSRRTAVASIPIAVGAFFLPEFLRLLYIETSRCTTLLIRIGTPLLVLLFGTFAVLLMVVQYSKTLKSEKAPSLLMPPLSPKINKLPKEQTDILIVLYKYGEHLTFQIAQRINMEKKEDIVKYHLRELAPKGFVKELTEAHSGPRGQSSWFITDKGKKYLIENKLIS
jgi:hypothetical protein